MTKTATRTAVGLIGLRLNVDGTMEDVRITVGPDGSHVASLNQVIGSDLFDVVGLPHGIDVFVDDEGLYRAEHSPVLSETVRRIGAFPTGYRLHGAGVFVGVDDDGDTVALTPAQRAQVTTAWLHAVSGSNA
ncbi:DUF3846 domain-containing protein (plasmid) [Curtobacterium sp. C1]|uniref:DUF3846 domain-containing protein n=1 Tax=Curtobacterium sp. C1 TaxID=2898151 RepID=UPI001E475FCE|nr:DUF3846 domain-containing protein [Curtobacterium sp. C1]UFU15909.1 DUF3846 domain-containing protein [Curtobacterium sp. C1]